LSLITNVPILVAAQNNASNSPAAATDARGNNNNEESLLEPWQANNSLILLPQNSGFLHLKEK